MSPLRPHRSAERSPNVSRRSPKSLCFNRLVSDPDIEKSQRVMKAMFPMKNINIETLKQAYDRQGKALT